MGVDFIEKTSRSFDKYLDTQRAKLATADLFTCEPIEACPTLPAVMKAGVRLSPGDELSVTKMGDDLVLRRGLSTVAIIESVPPPILCAVEESCGVATAVVQEVHYIAGIVEVMLC